jgi:hypothetical protein
MFIQIPRLQPTSDVEYSLEILQIIGMGSGHDLTPSFHALLMLWASPASPAHPQ